MATQVSPEPEPTSTARGLKRLSRGEVLLLLVLLLLGMGLWVLVDRVAGQVGGGYQPRREAMEHQRGLAESQARLQLAESEIKAIGDRLVQARLDENASQADLNAMLAVYPKLPRDDGALPVALASGQITLPQAYADALVRHRAAAQLVQTLATRVATPEAEANQQRAAVDGAQKWAGVDFGWWQFLYNLVKRGLTLLIPVALAYLLFRGLLWLYRRVRGPDALDADMTLVLWGALGLLVILFAYQTFEVAGAALAGAVVLVVALARLRKPRATAGEQAGGKQ